FRCIPLLEPMDVQAGFFNRIEAGKVSFPLANRRVAARGPAVGAEQQLPNTILFFSLLQPVQSQRTPAEIPRVKTLQRGYVFRLNGLGHRTQIRDDILAGIEETPPLPVE